jgi:hypothetical protein
MMKEQVKGVHAQICRPTETKASVASLPSTTADLLLLSTATTAGTHSVSLLEP